VTRSPTDPTPATPLPWTDQVADEPAPAGDIVERLRAAGCVFAEDEARLLVANAGSPSELADLVDRRVAGFPLEHILGWAEFCGRRISVAPGVFVPRRRTEFLVRTAIEAATGIRQRSETQAEPLRIVDLCCGSGAIGAVLADALAPVELYAADVDPAATRCARRNLDGIGTVVEGDLFDPLPDNLRGVVDLLVVNAPYVPTDEIELMPPEARLHEAGVALNGGGDGLDVHRRVAGAALSWLRPGGELLIETSERQAPTAIELLAGNGLAARAVSDELLDATVVVGVKPETS